ncbi:hypothetical protein GCM10020260_17250 [Nesterenkonia halobia]|uniref:Uncharacterized protein n=1 Tax=Nesterenkonia halobia TaxID=37922 RepID=A0ABP6RCQ4_9MICC
MELLAEAFAGRAGLVALGASLVPLAAQHLDLLGGAGGVRPAEQAGADGAGEQADHESQQQHRPHHAPSIPPAADTAGDTAGDRGGDVHRRPRNGILGRRAQV